MDCVIFDIDGTLADPSHRLEYLTGPDKSFEKYMMESEYDPVIESTGSLLKQFLSRDDVFVFFITARGIKYWQQTVSWLKRNFPEIEYGNYKLLMRDAGDTRDDVLMKESWVVKILDKCGYTNDIRLAFEDRDSVIQMYKKYDIFTIKVGNEPEFDPMKLYNEGK